MTGRPTKHCTILTGFAAKHFFFLVWYIMIWWKNILTIIDLQQYVLCCTLANSNNA